MRRGDVYELTSSRGAKAHEQRGRRYAVIVQAGELLALSTVVVAPTSTSARPASFRPELTVKGARTRLLVEQMAAVDPARLGRRVGRVADDEMAVVDDALRVVLGLW